MKPEQLTAWVLDEVSPEERAEIAAHVANDAELNASATETKAFCGLLERNLGTGDATLSASQRAELIRRFNEAKAPQILTPKQPHRPFLRIAAAIAACLALGLWLQNWKTSSPVEESEVVVAPAESSQVRIAHRSATKPEPNLQANPLTKPKPPAPALAMPSTNLPEGPAGSISPKDQSRPLQVDKSLASVPIPADAIKQPPAAVGSMAASALPQQTFASVSPQAKLKQSPMDITSDEATVSTDKTTTTFEGDVLLKSDDFEIRCEKLVVKQEKDNQQSLTATGPLVTVTTHISGNPGQIAKSRLVTYRTDKKEITLRGLPTVEEGGQLIESSSPETVITITANGGIKVMGSTKTTLLPK